MPEPTYTDSGNYYVEFRGNKITLAEWLKK